MSALTASGDTPLFYEPEFPTRTAACAHCGNPIHRLYVAGLHRGWVHTRDDDGSAGTGCPTNTHAEPESET